ncbi:filamentous hemagglutinin N-terminal domain-containing protein [Microbulbifer spongiae]|uniref:Filamentous hemagglutinin N-terminal domain-containing protein n=1 Tax=Microbulbifer spongiae TaxID=2944933 RepID=A0ABY9EDC6_9GAMM|nr:filamentous hemagglutinin N-terminal domain-containing protein [Microbulbifer sp. MI-G]WKD49534.1 filamentous hemagglutinin N-terminal domain-containing protein [Microbulbifer sp. MI-G]
MNIKINKPELKKISRGIKLSRVACAGILASLVSPLLHAGPEGGVVTGGSGTIDVNGTTTTIDQVTDLLSIDWDSFNLSEEELVKFLQPNASSIVLNRILDQNPSTIRGALESNGHVILVNPRGVLFTESATVNVGALTASGLDMAPEDFINGDFTFKGESGSAGYVINKGVINAASAVLVGKQVTNTSTGLIQADLVSLAAADEAFLTFDTDGLIGLKVTKEVMENELGVDSAVLNTGTINGAQVLMEASVSEGLFTAAVNNEGSIHARGIDNSGGKIRLFGSGSGVVNSGSLEASGTTGGEVVMEGNTAEHSGIITVQGQSGNGGQVMVLGDEVLVSGTIDARGFVSGGKVLVGGDFHGDNPDVRNAQTTRLTAEAEINVSGRGNGNGGEVIVWADSSTYIAGSIRAESGESGGDGGLIETSGKQYLYLDEDALFISTISHGSGDTGDWLLDPGWMEIAEACSVNCISNASISTYLENTNIEISVTDANTASGPDGDVSPGSGADFSEGILVSGSLAWSSANTLTLSSFSGIQISETGSISAGNGILVANSGGSFVNLGSINVADFSLTVGINPFDTSQISGTNNVLGNILVSNAGSVTAGSGSDKFTLSADADSVWVDGDYAFTTNNIAFTGIEALDLGGGEDIVTGIDGTSWLLTGNNKEARNSGILFSEVETLTATSANLLGTANDDAFALNAGGGVEAYQMTFSGLTAVQGRGGSDSVIGADGADWLLTGNNKEAHNSGILFSDVETLTATSANLLGTADSDTFTLGAGGEVTTYEMTFTDLTAVQGRGGSDSLDALAYSAGLELTGSDNQLLAGGLTFEGIFSATTALLTGSSGDDLFTITGTNALNTANIDFSGLNTVNAGLGSDSLVVLDLVSLTGNSQEAVTSGIHFSEIDSVTGGSLVGSDDADIFSVTGLNALIANDIAFSNISSVDAAGGIDTVNGIGGADWLLTGNNKEARNSGILFSDVETLTATSANLLGTANDDAFALNAGGGVEVYEMTFSGLTAVQGRGGSDSLNALAYIDGLELTGSDNQLLAGGLTFEGIFSATTALLTGSSGDDLFTITGTNSLNTANINFSEVNTVNAGLGSDSLVVLDLVSLTGNSQEAVTSGIRFSEINSVTGGSLVGSDDADIFSVTGLNALIANDIAFSNISSVDAAGGIDTVNGIGGADWLLTGNNKEASNSGILFSEVETLTATSANLLGTANDDAFALNAGGGVEAYQMTFSGLTAVQGRGGSDSLDALAYSAGLELTGSDNQLLAGGLTFEGIFSATTALLTGSSGDDLFTITGTNTLNAANINFSEVDTVNAGLGSDSLVVLDLVSLTGNSQEAVTSGIRFSEINSVTGGSLVGSDDADIFSVTGLNALIANDIAFSNISSVDAAGGIDTVNGIGGADWLLTGNNKEASNSGILFSEVETLTATSANLLGTADSDTFTLGAGGEVTTYEMTFTGLTAVQGRGGSDSLDALAYSAGLELTGSDNQLLAGGLTFEGIFSATTVLLTGSSGDDLFTITGTNALNTANIDFSGLNTVNAGLGSDSLVVLDLVSLTGNSQEAVTSGIHFSEIDSVTGGSLVGSDDADIFSVTGLNALIANDIAFSNISSVDAAGGIDTVNGIGGADWLLTGNNKEARNSGILFSDVETLTATSANLLGTANDDAFALNAGGGVEVYEMTFSGLTAVQGRGGSDSLNALAYIDGLELTGSDNQLLAGGLTFEGIFSATTALLTGSSGDDQFTITGTNSLNAANIDFSGLNNVNAGLGSNSLVALDLVSLTGNSQEVVTSAIHFSEIDRVTGSSLAGSDNADTFSVTGLNTLIANDIAFSSISSVDAAGGIDTVNGIGAADWLLTGNNKEARNSGILFSDVETLTATSANLLGTANDDAFALNASGGVEAYQMTFTGLTAVQGRGGSDSLNALAYSDGLTLAGRDNALAAGGLTFEGIFSAITALLTGSSGDDQFTITGTNTLNAANINFSEVGTVNAGLGSNSLAGSDDADIFSVTGLNALMANDIAFSNISSVDAAGGIDTVNGIGGADWLLTGNNKEASNSGILFSDVETLTATSANLLGTADSDTFTLGAGGEVATYEMTFTGLTAVQGRGGSDSLNALAYIDGLELTGSDNQLLAGGLTFEGIFSATTVLLTGSSGDDLFTITGTNSLNTANINFSEVNTVNAGLGSDSLVVLDLVSLTGNSQEAVTSGIRFSEINSVTGGSLVGSDDADIFSVTGLNALIANDIAFSNISSVDAAGGIDTVNGIGGADWLLTGNNKEASNSGILFSEVETLTATSANLLGTADSDTFTLGAGGEVTTYEMTFTGLTAVQGRGGSDSLDALAYSAGLELTGSDNQLLAGGLTFEGIFSATTALLTGSSGDDLFTITGTNTLNAANINFSEVDTVNAGLGSDSLVALDLVSLTGNSQEVVTSAIRFSEIDSVTGSSLAGSDNADRFEITDLNALMANDIAFNGISSVNALGGIDTVNGADSADWLLTGNTKEASNSGILFSDVETLTAINANLLGTANSDTFTLGAGGEVATYEMTFTGLSAVQGRGGIDSLNALAYSDGLTLAGRDNALAAGGLTFEGIFSATTALLTGSSEDDQFTITGTNSLNAANIDFSGLNNVNAGLGSNSLVALDLVSLTGNSQEVVTSAIHFSEIDRVTGSSLAGSDNADTFSVTGLNTLIANDIAFSSISSVDAAGGIDTVNGIGAADWLLTGNNKEARNSGILFSDVETLTATSANLLGTANDDAFALNASGGVEAYQMTFTGLTAVQGRGGSDSLNALAYSDGLTLAGRDNALAAGGLTFEGIFSAITALLTGSSGDDQFTITGTNTLNAANINFSEVGTVNAGLGSNSLAGSDDADIFSVTGLNALMANDIAFSNISSVDAAGGIDTVNGIGGADWLLTGNNKEASNSGILFSDVETLTATSANLLGTADSDTFTLGAGGEVATYEMTFTGLTAVQGRGGSDSLNALAYIDGLELTGSDNQLLAGGLTFEGIFSATTVLLTGSSGDDLFTITGTNALNTANIDFSGLNTVNAGLGSDSLVALDLVTLTGNSQEVVTSGIRFNEIDSVTGDSLAGSDDADIFSVTGLNALMANDIAFNGISSVDAAGGIDTVNGIGAADWLLTGNNKEARNSGILFSEVETLTATSANLLGTPDSDTFTLGAGGEVATYEMTFTGLTAVQGRGGSDSLNALAYIDGLELTGSDNQLLAGGLTFEGIFSAITALLTGSSGDDQFTITGTNTLNAANINFSEVDTVNAGLGSDSLVALDLVSLTGNSQEVVTSAIRFSEIDRVTGSSLAGSDNADRFEITGLNALMANDIVFNGISSVNALGGIDTVNGADSADWLLTGNTKEASNSGILFSDVETLTAINANLLGTANSDTFTLGAGGEVATYEMTFTGLSAVQGRGGIDSLNALAYSDGLTLAGRDNALAAGGLTFEGIFSATTALLTGSSGDDQFTITGTNSLNAANIDFSGLNNVNAGLGSNSLVALDLVSLTGNSQEVVTSAIHFSEIDRVTGSSLAGSDNADTFSVTGLNTLIANDIAFSSISSVDAAGGIDTVNGIGAADWLLTGNNKEARNSGILFSDVETLTATSANLLGTANDDAFALNASGGVEAYQMTFTGLTAVQGRGGSDSLNALAYSDGLTLTGSNNAFAAGALTFAGIQSATTRNLVNPIDQAILKLAGHNTLETAGIRIDGLESVNNIGRDSILLGTSGDDHFGLATNGDISAAGIRFAGLNHVDGAGGNNIVTAQGAIWTSTMKGGALVDGSAEATINNISVLFENLAGVEGTGTYTGQDIDSEYVFSSLNTMTIGGIAFADLSRLISGSGKDVIHGADIDANWDINDSQQRVSSDGRSLIFSGVESIFAGSGIDQFTLGGGQLTEINAGAGNDSVMLSGTVIDTISLGQGDDYVQVNTAGNQGIALFGGGGNDAFQYTPADGIWQIFSTGNSVGNIRFDGFELLKNTANNFTLETDLGFDFTTESTGPGILNQSGAGVVFTRSGMYLGYDGEGDIRIVSSSLDTIGGRLKADRADLTVAGDLDIETAVNTLGVSTSGRDIDISILAQGDLVIDEINAGRGTVTLASASFGNLTAETYGDTHITAGVVKLGVETQPWALIGSAINPLRMDATNRVEIVSITYYEPDFIGQVPVFTSTGDELQSIAGAQAAQGLKSAVQNEVEDFTQIDPAIFTAVNPYSSGVDAVNSPEMRLKSGELTPIN